MKTMFGLPEKVIFCSKCVLSNQRPASIPEFLHKPTREGAKYLNLKKNTEGKYICDACTSSEIKEKTNWNKREKELLKLLDKHRSKTGEYDCVVPGSGGKDSAFVAHMLKYKYNMNPLTITWSPHIYTDIGFQNFQNHIHVGNLSNVLITP